MELENLENILRTLNDGHFVDDIQPLKDFKEFENCKKIFCDNWINQKASINSNNSLMLNSFFLLERLSYQDCAILATDDIINSAIETICRESLSKWGDICFFNIDIENQNKIKEYVEKRFKELQVKEKIFSACKKALTYGGCKIFLNIADSDLEKDLILKNGVKIRLENLKVVEPYLLTPSNVNYSYALEDDFMKPSRWLINGGQAISDSRLLSFVFFDCPDLIKPFYNFLGISLCQFMKEKVKNAETIRASLADIFLRFRKQIIKTKYLMSNQDLPKRVKILNESSNNLGMLLLDSEGEDYVESITPLSGLDKIVSQAYENIAVSARMPAVKLLGLTPSGFNQTGEYDLTNFYDTIAGYQSQTIKPVIEKIIKILILELNLAEDISFSFDFKNPKQLTEKEKEEAKNLKILNYQNLLNMGVLDSEQVFLELKKEGIINDIEFKEDDF